MNFSSDIFAGNIMSKPELCVKFKLKEGIKI